MNIFILDLNPELAAQYHNDRHVNKMLLEACQVLCTAHKLNGSWCGWMYKPTHENHPCVRWAAANNANARWLLELGFALAKEYTYRFDKVHACEAMLNMLDVFGFERFYVSRNRLQFALAMPQDYKNDDPVLAYRNYYIREKYHLAKWTKRGEPYWWPKLHKPAQLELNCHV